MRFFYFSIFVLVIMFSASVLADIRHVPEEFPTIQTAYNNSVAGDTVLIQPGVYYETIALTGYGVTFASLDIFGIQHPPARESTIISGQAIIGNRNPLFYAQEIDQGELNFNGLSIVNNAIYDTSFTTRGAGIRCSNVSSASIRNCYFYNNIASTGGAVNSVGSTISFSKCEFVENQAVEGGALRLLSSNIAIDSCYFDSNISSTYGAGILTANNTSGEIRYNQFLNGVARWGGGMFLHSGSWQINNNYLYNNFVLDEGAGFNGEHLDSLYLFNNVFVNNVAADTTRPVWFGYGGGLYVGFSSQYVSIFQNSFVKNGSLAVGGAAYIHDCDNHFNENMLVGNYGGYCGGIKLGLDNMAPPDIYIEDCVIKYSYKWPGSPELYPQSYIAAIMAAQDGNGYFERNDICDNYHWATGYWAGEYMEMHLANNYWGDETGPYHPELNLNGQGNQCARRYNPIPFATEPFWEYGLQWEDEVVDFGYVFPGETDTRFINLTNTTTEELMIFNLTMLQLEDSVFTCPSMDSLLILPGETIPVPVTFAPQDTQNYHDILTTVAYDIQATGSTIEFLGSGIYSAVEDEDFLPTSFNVSAPYPNPFNSSVRFSVFLPEPGAISTCIYDINGRQVKSFQMGYFQRGNHPFNLELNELASGVYFMRILNDRNCAIKKILHIQ